MEKESKKTMEPYFQEDGIKIFNCDVLAGLRQLHDESIDMVIFSPPYYSLRKYLPKGHPDEKYEIGLEPTFNAYLDKMIEIMREIKRVMKKTATCFVNFGDCYGGQPAGNKSISKANIGTDGVFVRKMKSNQGAKSFVYATDNERMFSGKSNQSRLKQTAGEKCLLMQPERFAIRMVDELGFTLRNKIVWAKSVLKFNKDGSKYTIGSVMPSSVKSRMNESWEYLYFFVKNNDTILWRNKITKDWVNKKPLGIEGIEGKDWEWKECYRLKEDDETPCKRCQGTGWKKITLWEGYSYWCELDEARIQPNLWNKVKGFTNQMEYQMTVRKNKGYNLSDTIEHQQWANKGYKASELDFKENRPYGIVREREWYPNAKRNKFAFNYRVCDAEKKAGQPQFRASEEEIKNYSKKYQGKFVGKQDAEMFGSPRTRTQRKSLEERMVDTKNKDTKSSRSYNMKKLLSKVRLGIKPNMGMIPNKVNDPRGNHKSGPGSWRDFKDNNPNDGNAFNPLGKNLPTSWVLPDFWQLNPEPHSFTKEFGEEFTEHFAIFPRRLVEIPLKFGCPTKVCKVCGNPTSNKKRCIPCGNDKDFKRGVVLDPFMGSGTTGIVAKELNRDFIGIDISQSYCRLAVERLKKIQRPLF